MIAIHWPAACIHIAAVPCFAEAIVKLFYGGGREGGRVREIQEGDWEGEWWGEGDVTRKILMEKKGHGKEIRGATRINHWSLPNSVYLTDRFWGHVHDCGVCCVCFLVLVPHTQTPSDEPHTHHTAVPSSTLFPALLSAQLSASPLPYPLTPPPHIHIYER